jgi:hypothetical protein
MGMLRQSRNLQVALKKVLDEEENVRYILLEGEVNLSLVSKANWDYIMFWDEEQTIVSRSPLETMGVTAVRFSFNEDGCQVCLTENVSGTGGGTWDAWIENLENNVESLSKLVFKKEIRRA